MKPSCKITVPEVIDQFQAYYQKPGNGAGGSLHIVLDDKNIGDHSIQFCKEYAMQKNDYDGVMLADLLLQMSKTQRLKISKLVYLGAS